MSSLLPTTVDHDLSWGRYPRLTALSRQQPAWRGEVAGLLANTSNALPRGLGRSYGDSCLNDGGTLIDTTRLDRFIAFDDKQGILRCEAGVSLSAILALIVPRGWFLTVTPGTQQVTIGGAIANDVHGKSHHRTGSFGNTVRAFELVRSDGVYECSPTANTELFAATIGGLGLTGIITWAEIILQRIPSAYLITDTVAFRSIDEFFAQAASAHDRFTYTVAWFDCLNPKGRGIFFCGNFTATTTRSAPSPRTLTVPWTAPKWLLNRGSITTFNTLYYHWYRHKSGAGLMHYRPFFYPLDSIGQWNLLYGSGGFVQYQCVIPPATAQATIAALVAKLAQSGQASFLTTLKQFGDIPSRGMLSFPRPGTSIAFDVPWRGEATLRLLAECDELVAAAGGVVYPAKDARMSPVMFQRFYPQWREFSAFVDPHLSSSFWRRVTARPSGG